MLRVMQIIFEATRATDVASNDPRCSVSTVNVKYAQLCISAVLVGGQKKIGIQKRATYLYSLYLEANKFDSFIAVLSAEDFPNSITLKTTQRFHPSPILFVDQEYTIRTIATISTISWCYFLFRTNALPAH